VVEVGVLLDPVRDEVGEWLTDAAAFDAAGADALWLDPEPAGLDVLALAAALAAVTFRARLVVACASPRASTRDTVGRLSHGRLALIGEDVRRQPGFFVSAEGHWLVVPVPEGREAWRATRADAAERGARGLVVPADPRLLDLLRNPDDPGDRSDLRLAQG
jgi:hypothetical protein